MATPRKKKALKEGAPINFNWIDANDFATCYSLPHQETSHVSNQLLIDCGKDGIKVGRLVKYQKHVFDAGKARNPGDTAYFDNHGNEIHNAVYYFLVEHLPTTKPELTK